MVRLRLASSDPLALALAAAVLGSALLSIEAAEWVEGLPRLTVNGLGAMLLAWALLALGGSRPLTHLAAIPAGALAILWQVMPILEGEGWVERLADLVTRLNAWGYAARTGGINTDPLAFVLFLLVFAWLGGHLLAWSASRGHRPWLIIVFSGVVLLMNLSYAPPRLGVFFLAYTMASLLLVVRLNQSRAPVVAGGGRIFGYSAALALSLSLAAWFAPTPRESTELLNMWYRVNSPWQEGLGQLNRLFAFLTSKERPGPGDFDKALILRGSSNLSDEPVMLVESPEPRYWRGLSYDYYTGQGWLIQEQARFRAPAFSRNPQLFVGPYLATKEMTQTVSILSPKNNLVFAAGQARSALDLEVNLEVKRRNPVTMRPDALASPQALPSDLRPYADVLQRALGRVNPRWENSRLLLAINEQLPQEVRVTGLIKGEAGDILGLQAMARYPADITALYASSPLQIGQRYTVVSAVSEAPPEKLREVGTDYPSWVTERYLQLPVSLPERVRALTLRLTEAANNPYDKAVALEGYLRGLSYATNLNLPAGNVDRVDYLLFVLRKGYSAYFSTAMAVMLRTVGIPARVATGYTAGSFDPEREAYLVKESNAHGWVEVFFPRYGWVEFEPTPSLPLLARPSLPVEGLSDEELFLLGQEEEPEAGEPSPQENASLIPFTVGGWPLLGFWGMVLGGVVVALWLAWRRRWAGLDAAVVVYGKMAFLASLARLGPQSHQTPREYGLALQGLLRPYQGPIESIVHAYEKVRYGGRASPPEEAEGLFLLWRVLRRGLLRYLWRSGRGRGD